MELLKVHQVEQDANYLYAFELPRQQQPDQNNDPEVMQFKASQRLSNVQQPLPAVFGPSSVATNAVSQQPLTVNPAPSSSNSQNFCNSTKPIVRRTYHEVQKFVDETGLRGTLQGGGPKVQPTILKFNGSRFVANKKGSDTDIKFMLDTTMDVVSAVFEDLPVKSLQWSQGQLYLKHAIDESREEIKFLEITKKKFLKIVVPTKTYAGSISQIISLHDADKSTSVTNFSSKDFYNFLTDYKFTSARNEEPANVEVIAEEVTAQQIDKNDELGPPPSKKGKCNKISSATLNLSTVKHLHDQLCIQNASLPDADTISLPLESLEHDFMIRELSSANVATLLQQINNGVWNKNASSFLVNKLKESDKYSILDGNHRYEMMLQYNKTADPSNRISEVKCKVYRNLSFDQKLLIVAPSYDPFPQQKLTILQKVQLARNVIEEHVLNVDLSVKGIAKMFTDVMKTYLNDDYPIICNDLLSLPTEHLNSIFAISFESGKLEEFPLTSNLWKAFLNALKKNATEALQCLKFVEKTECAKVEKLLKSVEISVLDYMSERGKHECKNEQEAILYLTGANKLGRKDVIKCLRALDLDHNKSRAKKDVNWEDVKVKLQNHLNETTKFQNLSFVDELTEELLLEQNFIVIQSPCSSLLNLLEKCTKKAVILILSTFGSAAINLTSYPPTAILEINLEDPVYIDTPSPVLPQTTVKASLYIPEAPQTTEDEKILFLTTRAKEQQCKLSTHLSLEYCAQLTKLAKSNDNCLACYVPSKVAESFLPCLNYYKKVTFAGDDSLKKLVSSAIVTSTVENKAAEAAEDAQNA